MLLLQSFLIFGSLRIILFILHTFMTFLLFWSPYDSVAVSLSSNFSTHDYVVSRKKLISLIAFGFSMLSINFIFLIAEINLLSLRTVFNFTADCIATFFLIWMIIDGLDWRTYIYVVLFCT